MLLICDHSVPMGWRNRTKDFALLFKSFILGLVSPTNIWHYHANNKVAVDLLGCFNAVFHRPYRCFSIALKDCHKIFTSDWLWIEVCQNAVSSKVDITMTAINKKLQNQQHAFRPFPFLRSWQLTCFLTTCKCILNFHFKRFSVYLWNGSTEFLMPHIHTSMATHFNVSVFNVLPSQHETKVVLKCTSHGGMYGAH